MRAVLKITSEISRSHLGFGYNDARGREIGMRALSWEVEAVEASPENHFVYTMDAGQYFAAGTQATRNGVDYGASQNAKYFKTRDERDVYLARRWLASLNAAKRKAAVAGSA